VAVSSRTISSDQALGIVDEFSRALSRRLGQDLIATIVIGSLATSAYRPGRSDIDMAVIVRSDMGQVSATAVQGIADQFGRRYGVPKGIGAVLLRERELFPPLDPQDELAPEILRIRRQGIIVWGAYDLESVPEPTNRDLLDYANTFYPWLRANYIDERPREGRTVDAVINTMLYELRLFVWAKTDVYLFDKPTLIPTFLNIPGTALFATRLQPLQHYLTVGPEPEDLVLLESLLREVSHFVRDTLDAAAVVEDDRR
jgi:hypothetical protein